MASTKEYVVLVVTQMGSSRWCSIVVDNDGNKLRVNFPDRHLSPDTIRLSGGNPDLWAPGKIVSLRKSEIEANPRITHPEDTNFNPRGVQTTGKEVSRYQFVQNKLGIWNNSGSLFGVQLQRMNSCPVVPNTALVETSCCLVPVSDLRVFKNGFDKLRATLTINNNQFDLSVTSVAVRQSFEQHRASWSQNLSGIAVLGLSGSFRPEAWGEGSEFCFVQFNGFIQETVCF